MKEVCCVTLIDVAYDAMKIKLHIVSCFLNSN